MCTDLSDARSLCKNERALNRQPLPGGVVSLERVEGSEGIKMVAIHVYY